MTTEEACPHEILGWIPWYPDGLEEAQRGAVEAHAAECAECRDEIACLLGHATPAGPTPDPERIYAQVLARIEASPGQAEASRDPAAATVLPLRDRTAGAKPTRWQRVQPARAMALAATVLVALLVGAVGSSWLAGGAEKEPVYETASVAAAGDAPSGPTLDVVFREDIDAAQITRALRALQARITSGPSDGGVYRLELPADAEATSAARQLMGDRGVAIFAGPPLGGP